MKETTSGWAFPDWTDQHGNVKCQKCGKVQSPMFRACIACCPHDTLYFTEDWHGPDEGGGWELDVECADCGKNFDFSRSDIIANYKAVRRKPNQSNSGPHAGCAGCGKKTKKNSICH